MSYIESVKQLKQEVNPNDDIDISVAVNKLIRKIADHSFCYGFTVGVCTKEEEVVTSISHNIQDAHEQYFAEYINSL